MSSKKSGGDGRVQFTLRLEPELHTKLVENAGMVPLNVYLVNVLDTYLRMFGGRDPAEQLRSLKALEEAKAAPPLSKASKTPDWQTREDYIESREREMDEIKKLIEKTIKDTLKGKL